MKNIKGFTLIELLVVIAIIGILAGASMFGLQGIFENSRDTQRKSDLKQYQTALESYANRNNGNYPTYSTGADLQGMCGPLSLSGCPEDPTYDPTIGSPKYHYISNGTVNTGVSGATEYILWATLESEQVVFEVCSNGQNGNAPSAPGSSTCTVGCSTTTCGSSGGSCCPGYTCQVNVCVAI